LGHGVQKDEYYPRLVGVVIILPFGKDVECTATAGAQCSLLRNNKVGHVYYWGKHKSAGEAVMQPQMVDVLANNQHMVTQMAAGGQTVICSTSLAQTVAWGQGPHGELGFGKPKSSSKPTFVESLHVVHELM
jgi:alpha-tubulin suppressor-like RCC1 family protein